MFPDDRQCYRALRAHDARFDGRFFVGVSTTGIYCRPVCTARTPREEHCRFFPSAAAAEAGGFRPCLRCRPELAPGFAGVDANRRLARAAARAIEDAPDREENLEELAARLGVTGRHLRRVFRDELGVSPVEYAQTQRLLLAKHLLTDTGLPVLDVALASGFSSLRRFNHLFRTRYRMTPGDLRRSAPVRGPADRLDFELAYRPPYDWPAMLAFLGKRAIPGVEAVDGKHYRRTVVLGPDGPAGWISAEPAPRRAAIRLTLSASLAKAVPATLARVKHLLDLSCRPDEVAAVLGELAATRPGLRLPGAIDGFEVAVRAILGQQVTVRAATTIAGRFAAAFGTPLASPSPYPSLSLAFPSAATVATLDPGDISALGIISQRARAIVALAQAVQGGELSLEPDADVAATVAALESLPGVGPWTAQYIAMRALAWPDAFPHPDVAVVKAMGAKPAAALREAERFRPWRSYAVLHLWKSLEDA